MGSLALTALLSVLGRLVSQRLFETVATRAIIWLVDKLASMTETRLDDDIAAAIKRELSGAQDSNYEHLISEAVARADYVEAARLQNEKNGTKP